MDQDKMRLRIQATINFFKNSDIFSALFFINTRQYLSFREVENLFLKELSAQPSTKSHIFITYDLHKIGIHA